jgi:acyl-coenzyme A thioesterase PaaI-like protein
MTQIRKKPDQAVVLQWWTRLAALPAGNRLFSLALGWITPYSSTIGAMVEEIKPGYARVSVNDRRRLRNHLHSIHAIALINLGELTTGLAVLSTIPTNMRAIVLNINADYLKKARGKLTATAEFELPERLQDDTHCEVEAQLKDQSGETVTRVRSTWLIGYKSQ